MKKKTYQNAPVSSHVHTRASTSSLLSSSFLAMAEEAEEEVGLGPSFSMRDRSKWRCRWVVESVVCERRRRGEAGEGEEEEVEGMERVVAGGGVSEGWREVQVRGGDEGEGK